MKFNIVEHAKSELVVYHPRPVARVSKLNTDRSLRRQEISFTLSKQSRLTKLQLTPDSFTHTLIESKYASINGLV